MIGGAAALARWEAAVRPLLVRLPSGLALRIYGRGRTAFLDRYVDARPPRAETPSSVATTLWGTTFRGPLWNAAGLFKDGRGYRVVEAAGAGAFLAGTTTHSPRRGNEADGIRWPFAPFPRSGAAANWMGLPNPGHALVAAALGRLDREDGCPVGASVALDPENPAGATVPEERRLDELAAGIGAYLEAGVDFVELNESCPNTGESGDPGADLKGLAGRLGRVLGQLPTERAPLVVKLSNDLDPAVVPELVDRLLEAGVDGVNLGNTSTDYAGIRSAIAAPERRLYDRFTGHYGGGVSGRPLGERSLRLAAAAAERVAAVDDSGEFAVVRTGGVETAGDVRRSLDAGIAACQWYTGYFEAFSRDAWSVYPRLWSALAATSG